MCRESVEWSLYGKLYKLYANLSAFNVSLKTFGSLKYINVFQEIKREAMMQLKMSTADANKPENSFLNRYRDVKPYDHSRVKLETHHDTDYINASLVKVKWKLRVICL